MSLGIGIPAVIDDATSESNRKKNTNKIFGPYSQKKKKKSINMTNDPPYLFNDYLKVKKE